MSQLRAIRRHTRSRFEMPPSGSAGFPSQKRRSRDSARPDAESFCRVANVRRESLRGMFVSDRNGVEQGRDCRCQVHSKLLVSRRVGEPLVYRRELRPPREERRTQGLARATQGDGPRHPPDSLLPDFPVRNRRSEIPRYRTHASHFTSLRFARASARNCVAVQSNPKVRPMPRTQLDVNYRTSLYESRRTARSCQ